MPRPEPRLYRRRRLRRRPQPALDAVPASDGLLSRFHADQSGNLSFVSIFTMLAFLIIVCFIGNVGVMSKRKMELQNAADATAYSTALWQARSMNAVTATNHLMGELTSVVVLLDSLGGKMLGDSSNPIKSKVSEDWNDKIGKFQDEAPISNSGTLSNYLAPIDKEIVEQAAKLLTEDDGKHDAGATIYDAKITLKFATVAIFISKQIANVFIDVAAVIEKTPWAVIGYIIEGVAIGMHITMSSQLLQVIVEWCQLEALETAARIVNSSGMMRQSLQFGVLPALTMYADQVAGASTLSKVSGAPFNAAVRSTQDDMQTAHGLQSAASFPSWRELKLPLTQEPPPPNVEQAEAPEHYGSWDFPDSEWSGRYRNWKLDAIRDTYQVAQQAMDQITGKLDFLLGPLGKAVGFVSDAVDQVGGLFGGGDEEDDDGLSDSLDQVTGSFKEVLGLLDVLTNGLPKIPGPKGSEFNPVYSKDLEEEVRMPKFYWQLESRSQWVRATYPHVDDGRAPVLGYFKEHMPLCDAANFYVHWTNRHTLSTAYEMRVEDEEDNDEGDEERSLFEELERKVAALRLRLNRLVEPQADETSQGNSSDSLTTISADLLDAIEDYRGKIQWLASWFEDVDGHQGLAERLGDAARLAEEQLVSEQDGDIMMQQLALFSLLDELLTLMEDLLDAFEFKPPHMLMLTGATPETKGVNEPWATNRSMAERMFCSLAIVTREPRPLIADLRLFPHVASGTPRIAVAQAMCYNANGRREFDAALQPDNGWDTLNWAPSVRAPEWGDHRPASHSRFSPAASFGGHAPGDTAKTKLNWQAKLVPVTPGMIRRAERGQSVDLQLLEKYDDLLSH